MRGAEQQSPRPPTSTGRSPAQRRGCAAARAARTHASRARFQSIGSASLFSPRSGNRMFFDRPAGAGRLRRDGLQGRRPRYPTRRYRAEAALLEDSPTSYTITEVCCNSLASLRIHWTLTLHAFAANVALAITETLRLHTTE
uniref:Uncharacterized protein n=1 Tax=Heliothis virescens TaxID=7102 RepID=A0A2A4JWC7_HELVI